MKLTFAAGALLSFASSVASQQIWDIWETRWDRSSLFSNKSPSSPINFVSPGATGAADIQVNDGTKYQQMYGFGASLTDSSAKLLSQLKSNNPSNYNNLLHYLFDPTDGANSAAIAYLRVPLGASDFSDSEYNLDDVNGDTSWGSFNLDKSPSYLFSTLSDIKAISPNIKIHILPWSPPGWTKDSGTMNGGSLKSSSVSNYAGYLLKALQAFKNKGFNIFAITIQNEPENDNNSYPTCVYQPTVEAQVGTALRNLMNSNGFSSTKIFAYEHNWIDAGAYPVTVMDNAAASFAGASFHCYQGTVGQIDNFVSRYGNKEVLITECTGSLGTDWWQDIKWYHDNLFIGGPEHNSRTALMWNLALDGSGNPTLPGTNSCGGGCRGVVTINSDGTYGVNQEFVAIAHSGKAITPRDNNGPYGQRIGVSVGGGTNWALRVMAYETQRTSSTDWNRYSLVVLNWDDNTNGNWNPQDVSATIEFRGQQAKYAFPVGVTTLWWYAAKTNSVQAKPTVTNHTEVPIPTTSNGTYIIPAGAAQTSWPVTHHESLHSEANYQGPSSAKFRLF